MHRQGFGHDNDAPVACTCTALCMCWVLHVPKTTDAALDGLAPPITRMNTSDRVPIARCAAALIDAELASASHRPHALPRSSHGTVKRAVSQRETSATPADNSKKHPHKASASWCCSPEQIRTAVTALRGRRPRPLDDGAVLVYERSGGRTRTLNNGTRTRCVANYTTPECCAERPRSCGQRRRL